MYCLHDFVVALFREGLPQTGDHAREHRGGEGGAVGHGDDAHGCADVCVAAYSACVGFDAAVSGGTERTEVSAVTFDVHSANRKDVSGICGCSDVFPFLAAFVACAVADQQTFGSRDGGGS